MKLGHVSANIITDRQSNRRLQHCETSRKLIDSSSCNKWLVIKVYRLLTTCRHRPHSYADNKLVCSVFDPDYMKEFI